MIVGGIVLRPTIAWFGRQMAQQSNAMPLPMLAAGEAVKVESPSTVKAEPMSRAVTREGTTPFILLGSPQVTLATAILTNPVVQEWVQGILGVEQTDPITGGPMVY